ncbi:MAG: hypothetical protein Q8O39_00015 [bacterium]|nr:hypothetical protein [bacterium]
MIETEIKFKINNIDEIIEKIKGVRPDIFYCKDEIYGKGINYKTTKIRKRTIISQKGISISYEQTKLLKPKNNTTQTKEIKLTKIPKNYKCENSYDKIRYFFKRLNYSITIDIYFFGMFCEIEGKEEKIKQVAERLGFQIKDSFKDNIDLLYVKWASSQKRKELFHWGFGKF